MTGVDTRVAGPQAIGARTVIASSGSFSPGVVVVEDGLVKEVGPIDPGSDLIRFDVLAPGFCDLQVNGIGRIDVAVADNDDWATIGRALLSQGVTTWCPTLVTAPLRQTKSACERVARAMNEIQPGQPLIAGVHLEGPYITVAGAHREEHILSRLDRGWVDDLEPAVRIVTLAPEVPGASEAIPELCDKGILVSLGHSSCSAEQAHAAISIGARLVTHLGNASGPFQQRAPGLLGAALTDDRVAVSLIADLEHVHPDLLRLAFKAKGPGRVILVTDAVAKDATTVGPVRLAATPQGSAARLPDGTLAGSVLEMDGAVSNVISRAGVTMRDAVEAASTTPAGLLGLRDRGAIAVGRRADLVALRLKGNDPMPPTVRVEAVWIGGRPSWPVPA